MWSTVKGWYSKLPKFWQAWFAVCAFLLACLAALFLVIALMVLFKGWFAIPFIFVCVVTLITKLVT